jgi:hypothetical protein
MIQLTLSCDLDVFLLFVYYCAVSPNSIIRREGDVFTSGRLAHTALKIMGALVQNG